MSIDVLREAARQYVDATSLRHAARDIGMSPTGLRGFLDGADPYGKTQRKLTQWYVRERQSRREDTDADSARAALGILVSHFPPAQREGAREELLEVLDRRGREGRTPRPGWIAELRGPQD